MRDLFVVVPDLDAENVFRTLLRERQPALGVQLDFRADPPPQGDLLRFNGRDSGCRHKAVDLLRPPQRTHRHAIVVFDHHGSGSESESRTQIEREIEEGLASSGWPTGEAIALVIHPELEAWVWADSPVVAEKLGWSNRDRLTEYLRREGLWNRGKLKPADPKTAMRKALRKKKKPCNARLFSVLAEGVSLARCEDPAFMKLKGTLARWFPA